jgi:hypothetical protein
MNDIQLLQGEFGNPARNARELRILRQAITGIIRRLHDDYGVTFVEGSGRKMKGGNLDALLVPTATLNEAWKGAVAPFYHLFNRARIFTYLVQRVGQHEATEIRNQLRMMYENPMLYQPSAKGGKLSVKDTQALLKKSYDSKLGDINDYELDPSLSDKEVQVYKKKGTNEAVVVHRGTQGIKDWGTDLQLALGMDIKQGRRYKHSEDIQKKAEAKYGSQNVSTLGHSLGSKLASDVGENSKEIINLNKAVVPSDLLNPNAVKKNEYNIRTSLDPVSAFSKITGLFKPSSEKNTLTIPSQTINPLTEHSTGVLDRIDADTQIGRGHVKKMSKKHLKDVIKKLPKKGFKVTGKKKDELIDHVCSCCGIP